MTPLSPEIRSLVVAHMPPSDLARIARVSRQAQADAEELLYRRLAVSDRVAAHLLHRTLYNNVQKSMLVRHLTIDLDAMVDLKQMAAENSNWLVYHSIHAVCGLLSACRALESVEIRTTPATTPLANSVLNMLKNRSTLVSLSKDYEPSRSANARRNKSTWTVSELISVLESCAGLSCVRLNGIISDFAGPCVAGSPVPAHDLTELELYDATLTVQDLERLIGRGLRLRKFALHGSTLIAKKQLAKLLARCPQLEELEIAQCYFEDAANATLVDAALVASTRLKRVALSGTQLLDLAAVHRLQHVSVEKDPMLSPRALFYQLFSRHPQSHALSHLRLVLSDHVEAEWHPKLKTALPGVHVDISIAQTAPVAPAPASSQVSPSPRPPRPSAGLPAAALGLSAPMPTPKRQKLSHVA